MSATFLTPAVPAAPNAAVPAAPNPAVVADLSRLPPLPRAAGELLALLAGPEPAVGLVINLVGRDQALAARVLRMANSPWYSLRARVNTLEDAVLVLGLDIVRGQALAASLASAFPAADICGFSREAFWRHGLVTAICARQIALACPQTCAPALAYCAGLLHDIGRLALVVCRPLQYGEIAAGACGGTGAERAGLGIDHAQAGGLLARAWNLGPELCEAIAAHHAPPPSAHATLADVTHVADVLAHALDLCGDAHERVPRPREDAWARVGLDWDALGTLLPLIEQRVAHAAGALGPAGEASP